MDYKQLAEFNRGRRICQICLVTGREINDVLKEWVEKLQIGPWKVICFTNEVVRNGVNIATPVPKGVKPGGRDQPLKIGKKGRLHAGWVDLYSNCSPGATPLSVRKDG